MPTCQSEAEPCKAESTFRYTWPGAKPTHVCSLHMSQIAAHADPLQLAVEALGPDELEPFKTPNDSTVSYRVVRKVPLEKVDTIPGEIKKVSLSIDVKASPR